MSGLARKPITKLIIVQLAKAIITPIIAKWIIFFPIVAWLTDSRAVKISIPPITINKTPKPDIVFTPKLTTFLPKTKKWHNSHGGKPDRPQGTRPGGGGPGGT